MSGINGALSIAGSGISRINYALSVVGQNVANAGTPDWTAETTQQESLTAGGMGMGVLSLPAQRTLNTQLQASVFDQNAVAAGLQTQQSALSAIDQVQGQVGGGTDLSSLVGALQDAFSTLQTQPSNQTQQQAVVSAASSLTQQINALGNAVQQGRQTAQNSAVSEVANLNTTLSQIGSLSDQIVKLQQQGQSTADLQNQRDAAVDQLSSLVPVRQLAQTDGDVVLVTTTGLTLPTHGGAQPFSLAAATMSPNATYPADTSVPSVRLNGLDVTDQLGSGQLGANLTLRDNTLPAYQATLDEFSFTLADRFNQQGLALFTGAGGTVPTATGPDTQSGYVGLAQQIAVNPVVVSNPSLVRDGTQNVAGSATGASAFTSNPSGGPAGFTGMIVRVLNYAFGSQAQSGVAQPAPAGAGLGPGGDQSAGFAPGSDLADFASGLVGKMSQDSGQVTANLSAAQALQTGLKSTLASTDGVSIDTEMSSMIQLQQGYAANAKVIASVQSMFAALLGMVQ